MAGSTQRKAILLNNNDLIASKTSAGKNVDLLLVSPDDIVTLGTQKLTTNIQSKDGIILINGVDQVATKAEAAPIVAAEATVDSTTGTPSVEVTLTPSPAGSTIKFDFHGLKGSSGGGSGTASLPSDFEVIQDDTTLKAVIDKINELITVLKGN